MKGLFSCAPAPDFSQQHSHKAYWPILSFVESLPSGSAVNCGSPFFPTPWPCFFVLLLQKRKQTGGNILIHNQLTRPLYGWRAPPPITQYTEVRVLCFFPSRFPGSLVRHVPHPSRFLFSLHSKKFPAPKPSDSRFYAGPRNLPDVPLNNLQ